MILYQIYKKPSALILIAGNMALLAAALLFKWDVLNIVLFYLAETFIMGILNVFKMIKARPSSVQDGTKANQGCIRWFSIVFFIFHYNFFIAIQLILILAFFQAFGESEILNNESSVFPVLLQSHFFTTFAILTFSQIFSYHQNYIGKKEYLKLNIKTLMISPYKRIVFQQFFVIFGAILLVLFQMPAIMMIFYILLKTLFDLYSHLKTHNFENHPEFKEK